MMTPEMVFHNNTSDYIYPVERNQLIIRLKVKRYASKKCSVIYWNRTTPDVQREVQLESIASDEAWDYFETKLSFSKVARYQKYYFKITDIDDEIFYLTGVGMEREVPQEYFFEFLYANQGDCIEVPEWSKGCVYYQIFPERFCNGDKSNDPKEVQVWGTKPSRDNFMGGDLLGIIEKISYLSVLGIDCIYLNPIFKADFNHKYATTDYFEVDPIFGTNETLKSLVSKCHEAGIKVILDGVFNHVGIHFKQFTDVVEKGEKSPYKDWFLIGSYPFEITHHDYECVGAYKYMPRLNTSNPEVRNYILEIMEFWIEKYDIDGWRLDVADEVDGNVWNLARLLLKEKYPEVILLGETWGNGGNLLDGRKMDCTMNYCFRDAVRDYFAKKTITESEFDNRINHMLGRTRTVTSKAQYNLLDSHDTERFLFFCDGDKDRLKLAVAFQFLFVGAAAIYYGDEIGMTGDNDPDCRGCMKWNDIDENLLGYYRELISIRKRYKILRDGSYKTIAADDSKGLYAFSRKLEKEKLLAFFVRSNISSISKVMEEYFDGDISEPEKVFELETKQGSVLVIKCKEDI